MASETFIHPQRSLWLTRTYFFLHIGGSALLFPFLNLFFNRQGLSGNQIGWLGTVGALILLATAPLWGLLTRRTMPPCRALKFGLS
jgi:MFS family permease